MSQINLDNFFIQSAVSHLENAKYYKDKKSHVSYARAMGRVLSAINRLSPSPKKERLTSLWFKAVNKSRSIN